MGDFFQAVAQVLGILLNSSAAATMSGVGVILLLLTAVMAYVAFGRKPDETSGSLKAALYLCLVGGLIFSAAGPSLALYNAAYEASQNPIRIKSTDEIRQRLIDNARVRYVVRLISYPLKNKEQLSIDKVPKLGPAKQLYSFVGDYEELKGRTVAEALDIVGTGYNGSDRVTAIIFPLRVKIFPANARGLLQVVSYAESRMDAKEKFIKPETFNQAELDDLKETNINSYPITAFKNHYPHYCELARKYFCNSYPSRELIGGLYRDWHPLGFSQKDPPEQPCSIPAGQFCAFSSWDKVRADYENHFGSRAFLIENLDVNEIDGRFMIDFTDPQRDRIPEIGLSSPKK